MLTIYLITSWSTTKQNLLRLAEPSLYFAMLSLLQMNINEWMNQLIASQNWYKTGSKISEYVQFSRLRMSKAELLGARSTSHQHCELCSFLQRKFWGALSVQSLHERTQGFSIFHATFWCKIDQRTRNEARLTCAKCRKALFFGRSEVTLRTHKSNDAILSPARYFSRTSAASPNHQPYNQFFLEMGHMSLYQVSHITYQVVQIWL